MVESRNNHQMFVTEEDDFGIYGFCELCPDHHDMVLFKKDGGGVLNSEPKIFPSHHAWRTWCKGTAIFRVPGV